MSIAASATPGRAAPTVAAVARFLRRYVLGRLLTLWLISVVTFLAMSARGVSIAKHVLGRSVTPREIALFNHQHGFDRPVLAQYVSWLGRFLRGDWGATPGTNQPIREVIGSRAGPTTILALAAFTLAVPCAIGLGLFASKRVGRPIDIALSVGSVIVAATPAFVLSVLMILCFAVWLGMLPVDSTALTFGTTQEKAAAYVLPAITVAIWISPEIMRVTRSSVWETLSAPYAQAGVLRGLTRRRITWRYLLPNAAGPIVNDVALTAMALVTGLVVVENVFAFPGLGSLLVDSVQSGDTLTVQAIVVLTGALVMLVNIAADLIVLGLNPRLRT